MSKITVDLERLAEDMLEYRRLATALKHVSDRIVGAVSEMRTTVEIGYVRASYSAGRTTYNYEEGVMAYREGLLDLVNGSSHGAGRDQALAELTALDDDIVAHTTVVRRVDYNAVFSAFAGEKMKAPVSRGPVPSVKIEVTGGPPEASEG